jgi:NADPH-dependent 2,4-dienoyl-CoA reductase/sulfur reductase-like enzyme
VETMRTDVVIVGGGLGACAAALAAARLGRRVILTEETRWVGGQLTNQVVPPDEHPWIEQFGATASYRTLRRGIGTTIAPTSRSPPRLGQAACSTQATVG